MKKESIKRKGGVLMPISALPSDCGIGTLGQGAYDFVDWLESAGMTIWQVLPLLPTGYGDSPYQSCSSNAVNPYFIDFDLLVKDGLLEKSDYQDMTWQDDERRVDYGKQFSQKREVLKKAFYNFDKTTADWQAFLTEGKYADYALFMALKAKFCYVPWMEWPKAYAEGDEATLDAFKTEHKEEIEFWQFTQYLFLRQWKALLAYAHAKGVSIMGDMPIYLSEDSSSDLLHTSFPTKTTKKTRRRRSSKLATKALPNLPCAQSSLRKSMLPMCVKANLYAVTVAPATSNSLGLTTTTSATSARLWVISVTSV